MHSESSGLCLCTLKDRGSSQRSQSSWFPVSLPALLHRSCTLHSLFFHSIALNEVIFSKIDSGVWLSVVLTLDVFLQAASVRRGCFWVCLPVLFLHLEWQTQAHMPCHRMGNTALRYVYRWKQHSELDPHHFRHLDCRKHQLIRDCILRDRVFAL